ncbi:MAG: DUF1835 domain-containing protein [Actinobacteria bacterium]|nr:DUF1835 domain-containing protein [Actinomycetota bacterium]
MTNGDSVAGALGATNLGGAVLSWQDVLHEGPVPAGSRGALLAARSEFLAASGWGDVAEIRASFEARDAQLLTALAGGGEVVLWFEHDLYDQLQLVDVLSLAAAEGGDASRIELIVIGAFPGRPDFRGLGELTPAELESLWPARRLCSEQALAAAGAAWAAFRTPEPTSLAALAGQDMPELPFLRAALLRLLEELPGARDGLSGVERRALQAVEAGAASPVEAFLAAQDAEQAPFLGDVWFFRTVEALRRGEVGLVETRDGGLRLTELGRRVLAGEADRVALPGIDRWVGGTHLTPATLWRWDAARATLLPPA